MEFTLSQSVPMTESILIVDGIEKIDNDKLHSFATIDKEMLLAKGYHKIKILFMQGSGDAELKFKWKGPGFGWQDVPASALFK